MKKLLSLVFNRWVLAALGLCAIGLLIWFAGPLVAIANYFPLETARARWSLIGLVFLFYAARLLWKTLHARNANAKLMDSLLSQPAPPAANPPAVQEVAVLRGRFEAAIAELKKARLGQESRPSAFGCLGIFTRQWVYALPWYIFIGAPGSGKTTALLNSGLRFPLAHQSDAPFIPGVGGTRNCDWWFADDAVLLDTAGRYTTQESNREVDSAAWLGFLALLKKYRARRPINGVLLTLSVADLLEQNQSQREAHIETLRNRIEELHQALNIRFPLYILVTKTDLLAGFAEFFGEFTKEEREQVWGATFPYSEKDQQVRGASFAEETAALEKRINDRLIDRMQQERDPQKRAQVYLFPQQFNMLKLVLDDFLNTLFAPSRFVEKPLLRGVYFTSGTQDGSPIDRIMGTLGRALQLDTRLLAPNRPAGKSFFLTRLLKDVVFPEAGLAGTNLRWERQRVTMLAATVAVATLFACGAIGAWAVSYHRNRSYIAEVDSRRVAVGRQLDALDTMRNSDVVGLLPVLDSVRHLADVPGMPSAGMPLSMGFGLYQGDKLAAGAHDAYAHLLRASFLPRLLFRMERQLRTDGRSNPELLYEGMKAYLMLHDPQHFDAAALKAYITADWETSLPRDLSTAQRNDLAAHLDALLENGETLVSPIPPDKALIADTRAALARTPLANRIYNRLKRQGVASSIPEFTVAKAGGPSAPLVFSRASGQPLTRGVPGLYSFNGYHKAFVNESERVTAQLADEEGWVLGTQGTSGLSDPVARTRLLGEVRRLYLEDYARIWEAFVSDIKLAPAASLQQSIEFARILSAPDSPLPPLLRAIAREVTLAPGKEAEKSSVEKAGDKIKIARDEILRRTGQLRPDDTASEISRPEVIVDNRFDALRRMVRGEAGAPAPIDGVTGLINELYTMLVAADAATRAGNTPPPSELANKIKAEASRMPEPVRSVMLPLSSSGMVHTTTKIRAALNQAMRASVSEFCDKAIAGRYPFVRNSPRDVTQEDFTRLFSAGGIIDDFFQKNLAQYVNTSTRPWSNRDLGAGTLGASTTTLMQFQRAQTIREVFFHGGQAGAMRLEFRPLTLDATVTQFMLDVDGQLVKYSHGPQVPTQVQWPGPRGTTQVRIEMSPPAAAGASGEVYEGAWALFRMFDKVQIEPTDQPEKFISTFNIVGRKAQFTVFASSVRNPFRLPELEQFQCPSQL
jgi:type VI secretion system protein ImpL